MENLTSTATALAIRCYLAVTISVKRSVMKGLVGLVRETLPELNSVLVAEIRLKI